MSRSGIPESVVSFLREHVSSLWVLEILLLLHREPSRGWTASAIASELGVPPRYVEDRCALLSKIGLVIQEGDLLRFDVTSPLAQVVDQLPEMYRTHRVAITELIFSKPVGSAQLFADAFVINKGNKGNADG